MSFSNREQVQINSKNHILKVEMGFKRIILIALAITILPRLIIEDPVCRINNVYLPKNKGDFKKL